MKKIVILALALLMMTLTLTSCGSYTCYECGKTTSKAYYDYSGEKEYVLCEDCARTYWAPYDYKDFRVK